MPALTITSRIRVKPECRDSYLANGNARLSGLEDAPGFQTARLVQHADDPNLFLIVAIWADEQAWRNRQPPTTDEIADQATTTWANQIAAAGRKDAIRDPDGATITMELNLHPQFVAAMTTREENFEVTSSRPGFRGIRMLQHGAEPTRIIFIEHWDSPSAYRDYLNWRTERGDMEGLKRVASSIEINVWPTLVGKASRKEAVLF